MLTEMFDFIDCGGKEIAMPKRGLLSLVTVMVCIVFSDGTTVWLDTAGYGSSNYMSTVRVLIGGEVCLSFFFYVRMTAVAIIPPTTIRIAETIQTAFTAEPPLSPMLIQL